MTVQSPYSSRPAPGFHLFDAEPGQFACGYQDYLAYVLWTGRGTLPALQRIQALNRHMNVSHPEGHVNVSFVGAGVAPPAEDARDGFKRVFTGGVSGVRAMAIILDGEGFWASALRGAITNFRHSEAPRAGDMAVHVANSNEIAADWLGEQLTWLMSKHVHPGRLLRTLTGAQQALAAAAAAPA